MKRLSLLLLTGILLSIPLGARPGELRDARCYVCHKKFREALSRGEAHAPVAEGDCYACHVRHDGEWKLVLLDTVPKLCLRCHGRTADGNLHKPVSEGQCLSCHNPHNSTHPKLLIADAPGLCVRCHKDTARPDSAHAAKCGGCHRGHQSERRSLLWAEYPEERRIDFSEEGYALCFQCHDPTVFREPSTRSATAFRDGDENLHHLHTVGTAEPARYGLKGKAKRGLSCSGCHDVHGSDQAKAVRSSFEAGGMTVYTLKFTRVPGGGSCVVGCHKPQRYENTPAEHPAATTVDSDRPSGAGRTTGPALRHVN